MGQGTVNLRGNLEVKGAGCVSSCGAAGSGDRHVQSLSLSGACNTESFQTIVCSPTPIQVSTAGAVGAAYADLDILDSLVAIELLLIETTTHMQLLINASEAQLVGSAGTFPTSFVGGETLLLDIDGTTFTTTFDAADQTAVQVAARINAAAALAGLATPRAVVTSGGQIQINGTVTGAAGSVEVTGGTGAATLGLSGSVAGLGSELDVDGIFLARFPRYPNAPTRIQVSGQGSLTLTAGGRSSV